MDATRPGGDRPADDRARRHAEQGQARRQRHPRRLAGRGARPRRTRSGLPLYRYLGGVERARAAGADDEHPQRRRARRQQRRPPGVHDHAGRRAELRRGAAHGRRGLPRAQEGAARQGAQHRRRRRGRLRARTSRATRRRSRSSSRPSRRPATSPARTSASPSTRPPASSTTTSKSVYVLAGEGKPSTRSEQMVDFYAELVRAVPDHLASRTAWPRTTGTAGSC